MSLGMKVICDGRDTIRKKSVDGCGSDVRPLVCKTFPKPKTSEFYCENCHTSYVMTEQELSIFIEKAIRARGDITQGR